MKETLQRWAARFDALKRRERMLIFAAVVAALGFLGNQIWIEPQLVRHATLTKQLQAQQQSRADIQAKLAETETRGREPDSKVRGELQALKQQITRADSEYRRVQESLAPPEQMGALLEAMLRKNHNLRLIALTTLPVSPVAANAEARAGDEKKPAPSTGAKTSAAAAGLYKHGVEITVRGKYPDLLDYLAKLEKLPQKMYWGQVALATEEYPNAVLRVTLFTLSLDTSWLVI